MDGSETEGMRSIELPLELELWLSKLTGTLHAYAMY